MTCHCKLAKMTETPSLVEDTFERLAVEKEIDIFDVQEEKKPRGTGFKKRIERCKF